MKRSYKSNFPATLLTLIKVAEGALALFMLLQLVISGVNVIQTVSEAAKDGAVTIGALMGYFLTQTKELSIVSIDPEIEQMLTGIGKVALPILGGIILLTAISVLGYVLKALDAIGAALIRFSNRGAGLVRSVHLILSAMKIITILEVIVAVVAMFVKKSEFVKALGEGVDLDGILALQIFLMVIAVFVIIINLVIFFYHKDVATNMRYILRDSNGMRSRLRRNSLSGLSILFGVITTFGFLGTLAIVWQGGLLDADPLAVIPVLVYLGAISLKYYLLAASNRRLKKYAVEVRRS